MIRIQFDASGKNATMSDPSIPTAAPAANTEPTASPHNKVLDVTSFNAAMQRESEAARNPGKDAQLKETYVAKVNAYNERQDNIDALTAAGRGAEATKIYGAQQVHALHDVGIIAKQLGFAPSFKS